ncbi:MAG TPA: bifunctional 5,10-methylenetetrahydrofolate dehydrogenase/5,10-methenyltetrahydrofolate cyclohydrolase [Thermoplasmata archaeon]|nr:bifunctional 5,10-methylenetetrahydrofolate dehydrogenase/5,10-methenyltetrahydrofolate cyclohydrolase [Thermoplasmata archaeon]
MTVRLDGAPVAEALHRSVRTAIDGRGSRPRPSLVSVHRGVDSPFRFYLRRQAKAAAELGIDFRDAPLAPGGGPEELAAALRALDRDPSVHGVLLEHPLPPPFDFHRAIDELRPEKDVDGVGERNLGLLVAQRPLHVPAVASAALDIARHYALPVAGARVAVIGRSETVGRPLALLLSGRPPGGNATVTLVHSQSPDLPSCLSGAATIFSCVGRPGLLDRSVVPQGAHVVDVGLSSVPDPSRPGGVRAVGDADAASLDGWAGSLTPVPGGVGPVTVAELMGSTVRAWERLTGGGGGP